jgi:hypothetical protein
MGMLAERGGRLQGGGGGRQCIQNQKRDVFFFSVFLPDDKAHCCYEQLANAKRNEELPLSHHG